VSTLLRPHIPSELHYHMAEIWRYLSNLPGRLSSISITKNYFFSLTTFLLNFQTMIFLLHVNISYR
jgi:hypothetical protein